AQKSGLALAVIADYSDTRAVIDLDGNAGRHDAVRITDVQVFATQRGTGAAFDDRDFHPHGFFGAFDLLQFEIQAVHLHLLALRLRSGASVSFLFGDENFELLDLGFNHRVGTFSEIALLRLKGEEGVNVSGIRSQFSARETDGVTAHIVE